MARPLKTGLDYFPFDVSLYEDEKLIDVQLTYGPLGESIYTRLLCLIYKNGYYYRFESMDKLASLLMRSIGSRWVRDKKTVIEVVDFLAKSNLLSAELMQRNVLTSRGIQLRYQAATERRQSNMDEYNLLEKNCFQEGLQSVPQNQVSVVETGVNVAETPVSVSDNTQSKVKESKEKESKGNESKGNESKVDQSKIKKMKLNESRPDQSQREENDMESIASAISGAMTGLAGLAEKNNFYFSADKADYPQSVDEVRRELEKAKTLSPDKAARIAQKFFTYYALLDWKDKNGNPVKDWQKLLRWWADNERQEPARTNAGEYVSENAEAYRSFVYHMDE